VAGKINGKIKKTESAGTLGTFGGVFTPSVLTILGIILFRRLGYVVGQGGLFNALLIISFANIISILTSLSVAAIATNVKVKGGGDYYLISRTLGVEFGGAIGIVLFLAQSVSVGFYCLGFGEALAIILPSSMMSVQLIAVVSIVLLYLLARGGADLATKFQYLVMSVLGVALISFFWGGIGAWDGALLAQNWDAPANTLNFWLLFAIFFPAVTGFTQGISMSGDLIDPGKSIPSGTLIAVFLSSFIYFGAAIFFAAGLPQNILMGDYESMARVARFGWLIDAGVIAATLSSAMSSFMGAPRILQALSKDKIFPALNFFAEGVGPTNNPRNGIFFTLVIALITVTMGNLNLIAPVVSMCFLVSYGLLNYATWFEASTESPSFRPRFKWFNKYGSLAGALLCLGVMLAISPTAGVAAAAVIMAIYQYLNRTAPLTRWSDGQRSYSFQIVRKHLMEMSNDIEHPRDWRPQILAFSEEGPQRVNLLHFAQWLEGNAGITSAVQVIEDSNATKEAIGKAETALAMEIKKAALKVFPLVVSAPDLHSGLKMLLQAYGVGPLSANIVLSNLAPGKGSDDEDPKLLTSSYSRYLKESFKLGRNLICLKATDDNWLKTTSSEKEHRQIDVFWFDDATSRLCLLLAYLMTRTSLWEDATIRVLAPRKSITEAYTIKLEETLDEMRIDATLEVIKSPSIDEASTICSETSLVFLPFKLKGSKTSCPIGNDLPLLLSKLPTTALVLAAEDIDLTAEPDEGKPAEIAAAVDDVKEAQEKVIKAAELVSLAEETLKATEKAAVSVVETGIKNTKEVTKAVNKKIEKVNEARGKVKRALGKVEEAAKKAEEMGILIEPSEEIENKVDDALGLKVDDEKDS
jgi:amino acid transporter